MQYKNTVIVIFIKQNSALYLFLYFSSLYLSIIFTKDTISEKKNTFTSLLHVGKARAKIKQYNITTVPVCCNLCLI